MTEREIERTLARFEGLVHETARQIVARGVEMDPEDVAQLLRLKVWKAIVAFDATHRRGLPLRRFVFMCLQDMRKDLEKRPRRYTASIDEIRDRRYGNSEAAVADWFDSRYLSVEAEQVFAEVEDIAELPADLTDTERQLVALRLEGRMLLDIDRELGLSRAQRERVMRELREKLTPSALAA